jgi:hypothetical protein
MHSGNSSSPQSDSLSHRRYSDHANTPELEMLDPLDSMETLKKTSASEVPILPLDCKCSRILRRFSPSDLHFRLVVTKTR